MSHTLLPTCKTWNAHCAYATTVLIHKETPADFIPPQLWPPNSPDLNPVDISVWKILQEGVQNMHHWSAAIDDATDGWLPQWRDPACSTPFSVAVSVRSDQWWVFFTCSLVIFLTLCNQLDSNLANLEATVAVGSVSYTHLTLPTKRIV